ncbi:hypothetical protein M0804_004690 [Polistes exclamans]|nr:hypothetical protein M0804_004690 [Polistes exclamans]
MREMEEDSSQRHKGHPHALKGNMNNHRARLKNMKRGNRRMNIENVEKYSCALGETTEQVTAAQRVVISTCPLIYHLHFATVLIALVP